MDFVDFFPKLSPKKLLLIVIVVIVKSILDYFKSYVELARYQSYAKGHESSSGPIESFAIVVGGLRS